ncbi:MAG: cupredoxin domain-containing protein, partial [Acidobacteriota bacterium]
MKRFLLLLSLFSLCLAAAAEAADPVEVRLSEYAIEMPHTLPAGPTTFLVRNEGKNTHSFKIEGPGIAQMLETPVRPRKTGSLQVTLQPGDYKVYCPVGSHE